MRIYILEDAIDLGGVQHSTLNFCKGIKHHKDIDVTVIAPGVGDLTKELEKIGIIFIVVARPNFSTSSFTFLHDKFRLPNIIGLIKNLLLMARYRISIKKVLPSDDFILLTKGMYAHFASAGITKQLVWHVQDEISSRYLGIYRKLFFYWAKCYPKFIIVDGASVLEHAPNKVLKKSQVVFNGIDCNTIELPSKSAIRQSLNIPEKAYCIGHIARITPWKGQQYLLEAFNEYFKMNCDAHLILIGSPLFSDSTYNNALRKFTQINNLEKHVHFLGYRTDLAYCLKAIDCFIYPSVEKDTSPLSLIHALVASKPVAYSAISGLKEMMKGLSPLNEFNSKDKSKIVEYMKCFEDENIRNQQGKLNHEFAISRFSIEAYTTSILEILESQYE